MSEIFNIPSEKIKDFLKDNSNSVVLDVRTEEEWNGVGKPDAESDHHRHRPPPVHDSKRGSDHRAQGWATD